jgi:hypothetical protein
LSDHTVTLGFGADRQTKQSDLDLAEPQWATVTCESHRSLVLCQRFVAPADSSLAIRKGTLTAYEIAELVGAPLRPTAQPLQHPLAGRLDGAPRPQPPLQPNDSDGPPRHP